MTMISQRQRQVCALRERLDRVTYAAVGLTSFGIGLFSVGVLAPVGGRLFLVGSVAALGAVIPLQLRAVGLRRRLDELTFWD